LREIHAFLLLPRRAILCMNELLTKNHLVFFQCPAEVPDIRMTFVNTGVESIVPPYEEERTHT
jgi:hypothetical protein